jgi:hypothetical protein
MPKIFLTAMGEKIDIKSEKLKTHEKMLTISSNKGNAN